MRWCELYPPYLVNAATLPCESEKNENAILQQEIINENCITCIIA